MALATLSIDLVAKIAQFEQDLGRATRLSEQQAQRIGKAFATAGGAIQAALGAGLAASLTVAVRSSADYTDQLGKLAQRSGVAAEAMSGLNYAAELADVSQEDLSRALKKLSIDLAAGDGKLKAMGITATTADGALLQLADRVANMPDGVRKTALAAEFLGEKFGPKLITMPNMGGDGIRAAMDEARKFGIVVNDEATAAAEKFNDNLTRLSKMAQGAKIALTNDLVVGLGNATEAFIEAAKEGNRLAGVIAFVQTLITGTDRHKANVDIFKATEQIVAKELELAKLDGQKSQSLGDQYRVTELRAELSVQRDRLRMAQNYANFLDAEEEKMKRRRSDSGGSGQGGGGGGAVKGDPLIERGARFVQGLNLAAAGYSPDFIDRMKELNAAFAAGAIKIDGYNDAIARLIEQQPFSKDREKRMADLAKLIGDPIDAELAAQNDWQRKLNDAKKELDAQLFGFADAGDTRKRLLTERLEAQLRENPGRYTPEEIERMVLGIAGISKGMKEATDVAGQFATVFESGFEKAILSGEKLSVVLKSLAQDVLQVGIRTAITQPLGKAAGDWFGDAFKGLIGGIFGGFKADGGPVSAGRAYIVGERGPELFMPSGSGRIIPNHAMAGGGPTIIIQNTIGPVASQADVAAGMNTVRAQIMNDLTRSRRYGGPA